MRSTTRFAATAVTASLALAALSGPGTAFAAGPDGAPGAAHAATGQGRAAAAPSAGPSAAAATPAAEQLFVGPRAQQPVTRKAAAAQPAPAAPAARPAQAADRPGHARPHRPAERTAKPAPAARTGKPATSDATVRTTRTDPRGNNGTFKVDGPVLDTSHGNEPHVSCAFRLNLFGYDAGQLARIAFTAVAPTPGATTRVDGLPLISTSTAKGGQYDGSYPAAGTLTAADLGLDPTVAHHVKVRVESVNADGSEVPGGAKSKVFWLEPCAQAEPAAVETTTPVAAPRAVVPAAAPAAAPAAPAPVPAVAAPVSGSADASVLGATVSARAAAPVTVLAVPELLVPHATAHPAQLPFTGSSQTLILLMLGLVTLAGGSVLLIAVRRAA